MLRNLEDVSAWMRDVNAKISRILSGAFLENSSITNGRMRFIGGTLRVDSGGRVEIEGTLEGGGTFVWTGTLTNNGPLVQNGTWKLNGTGEIVGNTLLTGNLTVSGGGKITAGSVRIENGKIYIGTMVLDPTNHNGMITFPNDSQVLAQGSNLELYGPMGAVGRNGIRILPENVSIEKLPSPPVGIPTKYVVADAAGNLYKASVGGGGGDPGDPPAGNPNGYIWPADPAVYGISDNFAAHIARGSAEPGVDVMTPVGTPLWSPANGTIVAVQTSPSGATGRYITLVTTEGDWFRFLHNSAVTVTPGQTVTQTQLLGYTGGSGFGSEAYYGPHTHISFSAGYTGTFPGASAMDDFQAYMAAA